MGVVTFIRQILKIGKEYIVFEIICDYTQYGPIKNVGIFPGLGVLYFCPDFQG